MQTVYVLRTIMETSLGPPIEEMLGVYLSLEAAQHAAEKLYLSEYTEEAGLDWDDVEENEWVADLGGLMYVINMTNLFILGV